MQAQSEKLDAARSAIETAAAHGEYKGAARADLDAARTNLRQAEAAQKKGRPRREVDNLAYAAEQLAMAAMARYENMLLQDRDARDREAEMAQHRAETAEQEAERVQQLNSQPQHAAQ